MLFGILFLGLFFRLYGNNWDQGWHLHPDERFLTMVGVDVKIPSSFSHYLDQTDSSFNPVNRGHEFYVYGTFPILLNKLIAQYFYNDTYDLFNLQGRVLSGLVDFFVILIIYKLIELVEKKLKLSWTIKYFGAFFYAIAVLPIQLSHFFAVDTFLNFFCWLSLYYAVRLNILKFKRFSFIRDMCLSGLFLGLAFACKVSAIYFAPLIGFFVLFSLVKVYKLKSIRFSKIYYLGIGGVLFFTFCYLTMRLGSPYYFETGNILNPLISNIFMHNLETLKSFENPLGYFPPAIQWFSKSYDFSTKNIIFFGVGPFYFLLSLVGAILLLKKKNSYLLLSIVWILLFLAYQSLQFAKTMRYLLLLYPFLAFFAAVGIEYLFTLIKKLQNIPRYTLYIVTFILILIWPLAFMSIYTKDHTRVTASEWIYRNIPSRNMILTEYWDDALPLPVQNPASRNYVGKEVHIFDPDTHEKWDTINPLLIQADYYIMSSNRAWGSIMEVPERYPTTSHFYASMLKSEKGYVLVKEFTSHPSLRYLGIPLDFPDQWAEEAFTVYDHPLVKIFKRK